MGADDRPDYIGPPPGVVLPPQPLSREPEQTGPTFPSFRPPASARPAPPPPSGPPVELPPPAGAPTASPPDAIPAPRRAAWSLETGDGQRIAISSAVVLGRAPTAPASRPDARAVSVTDPERSVSKTHALFEVSPSGLTVTDLHSTNGVDVSADGAVRQIAAGVPHALEADARVLLGDFTVTVRRADAS